MLWSILILTISSRPEKFRRLCDVLLPQVEGRTDVEVVGLYNNGERSVPEMRQALLEDARGKYVSFIDDDDLVPPDYVWSIAQCFSEPDVDSVGFMVHVLYDGEVFMTAFHGRQFGPGWRTAPEGYYRDWTPLNPVRTSIARHGDFRKGRDIGEDHDFREQIIGLMGKEEYIPRVMYFYHCDRNDSRQRELAPMTFKPRPLVISPAFRWHEWSSE